MNQLYHVAIIMDGNGRWGLKKNKSRNYGHFKGLKSVETVIKLSIKNKIPFLTLYTFSTENWKRPENEVNFLFDLIRKSLKKNLKKIIRQEIKINIIGKKKGLPKDISKIISFIKKKTIKNKKLTLNLALNYGSQEEILSACRKISKGKIKALPRLGWNSYLVAAVAQRETPEPPQSDGPHPRVRPCLRVRQLPGRRLQGDA